jgi:hypothetical protein
MMKTLSLDSTVTHLTPSLTQSLLNSQLTKDASMATVNLHLPQNVLSLANATFEHLRELWQGSPKESLPSDGVYLDKPFFRFDRIGKMLPLLIGKVAKEKRVCIPDGKECAERFFDTRKRSEWFQGFCEGCEKQPLKLRVKGLFLVAGVFY